VEFYYCKGNLKFFFSIFIVQSFFLEVVVYFGILKNNYLNNISKILSTFNRKIVDNLSSKRRADKIKHLGAVRLLKLP
jgi:hypothetical protein